MRQPAAAPPARRARLLVAYSTPQVVYDEVIPEFQKTAAGKGVGVQASFGASGDQSRAVEAGLPADVVTFSLEPDVTRLVKAGLVAADWASTPNKGLVTTSVVVVHRPQGQPEAHQDLGRPAQARRPGPDARTRSPRARRSGTCSPPTGQAADGGKNPQAGLDYVSKLLTKHVKVQDKSGREALQNFIAGTGDVLLSYEYEATTAQKKGEDVDYVTPDDTIKINIDIAERRKNAPATAQAFIDYVLSQPGAGEVRRVGLPPGRTRPCSQRTRRSSRSRPALFTIEDLGGWTTVNDALFDPEKGVDREDRGVRGGVDGEVSAPTAHPQPPSAAAPRRQARAAARAARGGRRRAAALGVVGLGSASSSCCRSPPSSRSRDGRATSGTP